MNLSYENLMNHKISYFNIKDIASILDINLGLALVEQAYTLISQGGIDSPSKISVFLPENSDCVKAWINAMPALIKTDNVVGQKWVSVCSNNSSKNLPTTIGTILLNDAISGVPLAIIDGTYITHIRTGVSLAIGVKYFTDTHLDELTLIGAGSEARTALLAISKIRNLKKIRLFDINPLNVQSLISELGEKLNAEFVICKSAEEASYGSKCVISCTTASEPVVYKQWCDPLAFISSLSGVRDIDLNIINSSQHIVFDRTESAIKRIEALSNMHISKDKAVDLCDYIANNNQQPYLANDKGFTTYLPLGLGGVDVYIANYIYSNNNSLKQLNF
ncbi:MAG: alanine dehydrogenase [Pseudomonadota bacterium]|nr:alanine dehydrogenase [Pseudomonadota bacterium]